MMNISKLILTSAVLATSLPAVSMQTRYFDFCARTTPASIQGGMSADPYMCFKVVADAPDSPDAGYTSPVTQAMVSFAGSYVEVLHPGTIAVSPTSFAYSNSDGHIGFDLNGYWSGIDGKYHGHDELNGYFTGYGLGQTYSFASGSFSFNLLATTAGYISAENVGGIDVYYGSGSKYGYGYFRADFATGPIPEAGTVELMLLGIGALWAWRFFRRQAAPAR